MTDGRLVETWSVRKPAVESAGGLVASQHYLASDVGARVLADGGNAVDAALAAGFAIGAVEPWMSGLGAAGYMLVYSAREGRAHAVDFGLRAPQALDPADYPLAEGSGADLFNWPAVFEDRNQHGYRAMAVPGYVAGAALALESFGTRGWAETLAPAIGLAEAGMTCDWYATLTIATEAALLARYPESRRTYLPDGLPLAGQSEGPVPVIRLGNLPRTLRRLAEAGPRDFYDGEIAGAMLRDLAAAGSRLSEQDLRDYRARIAPADTVSYRGATVHAMPGLTAGPTLRRALGLVGERLRPGAAPDAARYAAYAQSLLDVYAERLSTMGDSDEAKAQSCTTHLSVVDAEGNMVALTQTLLSLFGSRVMLPETGILMNNGIMWFDPRPGRPNSIGPGKRPLSNMCPTIVEQADGLRFAMGASGGRRIMPAILQLISFLVDCGMDLDAAIHTPRLDVSGTEMVTLDDRLPPQIVDALSRRFTVRMAPDAVYPALFARPNAVGWTPGQGRNVGVAFVMSPWAKVSAER